MKPECSLLSSQVDAGRLSDVEALAALLEGGHGVLRSPLVLIWVSWCGAALTRPSHRCSGAAAPPAESGGGT